MRWRAPVCIAAGLVASLLVLGPQRGPAQPPCTHVTEPCRVWFAWTCCLNPGGLQTGREPESGEMPDAVPVEDPPQCGLEYRFSWGLPCARWVGDCGGSTMSQYCL